MKKLLLTLFALAGMASAVVASGPVTLPGFKKRTPVHRQAENRQTPPATAMHARFAAPSKSVMRQAPAGMEYVDRLLKVDETLGSWVNSRTFEYDEYGFPKKVTNLSGSYSIYEYTWQVPGKIWASKKVCTYGENGSLEYIEADIARTFYPDGAVRTSTVRGAGGYDGIMIYEYDNDGNLIKETENRENGEIYIKSYTYFPLLKSWLESSENPWEKVFVTLDGDNGYIIENWRLENNVWRKYYETGTWYNDKGETIGGMNLWYEAGGVQGYGDKTIIEESADGISETKYILDEDKLEQLQPEIVWLPSSKAVYSPNYYDPWIYEAGEVRTKELYDYEDNQWVITFKKTITWVKDNVVKEVTEDYEYEDEDGTSYCFVRENGELVDDFYYDEATGNYAIYEYDGVYDYYTYYDAAGNVISKFRENEKEDSVPFYEKWVDGAWSKCTGTVTLYEDGNNTYVVTLDEQGRVVRSEEYENGIIDGYSEYTYTDNGYVDKTYERVDDGDKLYLSSEESYTTEGNIVTNTDISYTEDGIIEYGYRSVKDKEKLISYNYYFSNGEWVLENVYVDPVEEILADGTRIYIERGVDADGNVVNISKSVDLETPEYRLSERYEWNVERNDWDGQWKNEEVKINRQPFAVVEPVNPEVFEDEYFFPVEDEAEASVQDWCYIQWQWDYISNTWVCYSFAPEYTYPDEYTQVVKLKGLDWESTETIKVDSERRKLEFSSSETKEDQTLVTQHSWEYDDKGRVVSDIEHRADGDTWSYYYTYGPIEVISGIDDVISGSDAKVTVYNLQGICVLRDAAREAVGVLPRGLYIINGKKVAIR